MRSFELLVKRIIDLICSAIGLVILLPLFLLTVIMIEIFMPGPIFFKQRRVGKNGKPFNILKFRSMKVNKEIEAKHDFTKDDSRITPFGKIIRRLKIDELPQLINVFIGDMSMVGPRPTVKEQTDLYNNYQKRRLEMRPGMTGLAQVNGNITLSWDDRIVYDIKYIDTFSLLLDIKIMFKTIAVVIFGEDKFRKEK